VVRADHVPYTSGDLHIGHWYPMAPSDVHARFKRMQGYTCCTRWGSTASVYPRERRHPARHSSAHVDDAEHRRMRGQLEEHGAMYDWDREVITCDPAYYKWTQWFFIKLFEHDLAYRGKAPVNWCPKCQVVWPTNRWSAGYAGAATRRWWRRDLEPVALPHHAVCRRTHAA